MTVVLVGFVPICWALGIDVPRDAFVLSGASLLTLGTVLDTSGPPLAPAA